jgi:uncharacterized protein YfaS (alpha-2-macroglobulin family)
MDKYAKQWEEIYKVRDLPETVSPLVGKIYREALALGDYEQVLKAVVWQLNIIGASVDNDVAAQQIIDTLQRDVSLLPQPAKSVVYSMIAQMYNDYFTHNRAAAMNRTYVATDELADFKTWDGRKLTETIQKYYALSLSETATLQQTPIENYKALLTFGYEAAFQPTLYDLLANRALSYYLFARNNGSFVLDKPDYFADIKTFTDIDLKTDDVNDPRYQSLKLYQDLLKFHLKNPTSDGKALIETDMRRIKYMHYKGIFSNQDEQYIQALKQMIKDYERYSYKARIELELANYYCELSESETYTQTQTRNRYYQEAFELYESISKARLSDEVSADKAEALLNRIRNKELTVKLEEHQIPHKPVLAFVRSRNIDTVYQFIYSISEKEAIEYEAVKSSFRSDSVVTYLKKLNVKPVVKKHILPKVGEFYRFSTEIRLDGLKSGFYIMAFSGVEELFASEQICSELIQFSFITALEKTNNKETVQILVADRSSGKPLEKAKITLCFNDSSTTEGTTGRDGIATMKDADRQRKYYLVKYGNETLYNRTRTYYSSPPRRPEEQNTALVLTDRAIYRPGQTVYWKAILYVIKPDNVKQLATGKDVTARLLDANQQTIRELQLRTNDFGSIDGNFIIPQGLLNGAMTVKIDSYGFAVISVGEYKRPTFEVVFDTLRSNYALNDDVRLTGKAKAYSGAVIDKAKVQYSVTRTQSLRPLYGYTSMRDEQRQIANGEVETDANGAFAIDFKALADDVKTDARFYTYSVNVTITDGNGESQTGHTALNLSAKPLIVSANIADNGIIVMGKTDDYTVETTNTNRTITPASVTVEFTELQAPSHIIRKRPWEEPEIKSISEKEFKRDFPLDSYSDESRYSSYKPLKKVAEYRLLISTEKAKLDFSALKKSGFYRMALKADNHKGTVVEDTVYFCLTSEKPETIYTMEEWITFVKDKAEPGDNIEVQVAGGIENGRVYYELIHNNRVVEAKWTTVGTKPSSISIPVKEEYRGGFFAEFTMVQNNRIYHRWNTFQVPFTNKSLDVSLTTFRDKLLPGENETWTMKVASKDSITNVNQTWEGTTLQHNHVQAEIAATLYDASLDALNKHSWPDLNYVYGILVPQGWTPYWNNGYFYSVKNLSCWSYAANRDITFTPSFADVNWEGREYLGAFGSRMRNNIMLRSAVAADEVFESNSALNEVSVVAFGKQKRESASAADGEGFYIRGLPAVPTAQAMAAGVFNKTGLTEINTRKNFNETAFFYPRLVTDEHGEVLVQFTIPEALTRWRLLSFAHTKDLKIGTYTNELLTQKQVAVSANAPRFFRENDEIEFSAKVGNLTDSAIEGQAMLRLYDAVTMTPLSDSIAPSNAIGNAKPFSAPKNGSTSLKWRIKIHEGIQAITYKLTAQSGTHSDGEENTIPVLTNRQLVTETLPFSVRAGKSKSLTLDKLAAADKSRTLRNHNLTLEFTSAPAWYAVQSLPYIMEYPYECAEQVFSRYYANSLASSLVARTPRLKQMLDVWKTVADGNALVSALEKNEELKQVMLEETPWVMSARNETESKKRLALLFDLNRMSDELSRALSKLEKLQNSDGGFPWFEKCPSNRYITQHIVSGFRHLQKLTGSANQGAQNETLRNAANALVRKALPYLDAELQKDYETLKRNKTDLEAKNISCLQLHGLYAKSFAGSITDSIAGSNTIGEGEAVKYYVEQTAKYWNSFPLYEKGLAALVLYRFGKRDEAKRIIRSLKERASKSEEMGMYWKDNVAGWSWSQAPIETQALMIEVFSEVSGDGQAVDEMRIWLLRNKQTNRWETTKATTEAIYALLLGGGESGSDSELLNETKLLEAEIGGKPLKEAVAEPLSPEAGTGYVKTVWNDSDVKPSMALLTVSNPNAKGIAWGALYWQYFEQLDKITSAETNLKMSKQLYRRVITDKGEELQPFTSLNVGDLVRVRLELRADRDFEYVHLKDMRAAGFEPASTLSGYCAQDGLWYYQNIKDASVNFFISYLPKGTYVFEYDLRVQHAGDFSNGITTFQCMYAPEFSAHSEGIRLKVE